MESEPAINTLFPRERCEISPGAVHVPDWLNMAQQRQIVAACCDSARVLIPMRPITLPSGKTMSVRMVFLGWRWVPYTYTRAPDESGNPVAEFPAWLADLGRQAVADAYQDESAGENYKPDAALINFYDDKARMGMHQDKDEKSVAPVVSLSIGNTCVFRFGNTANRNKPYTDIELTSGDLFVFGGPSRFAYHGVPKVCPGTANPETGLLQGRLNITMRVTGMG